MDNKICEFDKNGVCEAMACYSYRKCGARDPSGNPIYKSIKPKSKVTWEAWENEQHLQGVKPNPDRTKLHEWGSPTGLPKGWRGRILKSSSAEPYHKRLLIEITNIIRQHTAMVYSSGSGRIVHPEEVAQMIVAKDIEFEEKWQADFTDKTATKYEKRVAEIEELCSARVARIFEEIEAWLSETLEDEGDWWQALKKKEGSGEQSKGYSPGKVVL